MSSFLPVALIMYLFSPLTPVLPSTPKFHISSVRESESGGVRLLTDAMTHFERGQLRTTQGPAAPIHYCTCKLVGSTCGDSFPFTIRPSGGDGVEHERDVAEPMKS